MTRGEDAERRVEGRLRAALPPPDYRIYCNVTWTGPVRRHGPARDGEADAVIAHPEHGLLVLEVKAGQPSRDGEGRWHIGSIALKRSPFRQAEESKHFLRAKLIDLPDWPPDLDSLVGHAVAFPDIDLASLPRGHALLGVDAPTDLVLDATALETTAGIQAWLDQVFEYWAGDGAGQRRPLGEQGVALVDELLRPTVSLHRLIRGRIEDDREELVAASREQSLILNRWRSLRQVEVIGPAGSGKSMLAAEKARRLAAEGYRTLLVCFNQRLATTLLRDLADARAPAGLDVTTFHRLCERWAQPRARCRAGPAPSRSSGGTRRCRMRWTRPSARPRHALSRHHRRRGPGLRAWLAGVAAAAADGPAQATSSGSSTTRPRRSSGPTSSPKLGFQRMELYEDHRNPPAVARLAARFRDDAEQIVVTAPGGPARGGAGGSTGPVYRRGAAQDAASAARWRNRCRRSGWPCSPAARRSGATSGRQRRFGNAVLWNEAIDDQGRSRGLPPEGCPMSRTTSSSSRPSAASRAWSARSSSSSSCRTQASGWTSSSTSA